MLFRLRYYLIISTFFLLTANLISANIKKKYNNKEFQKIIYEYKDNNIKNFTNDQLSLIADALRIKNHNEEAKKIYFFLLKNNYTKRGILYKLWRLLDNREKEYFFKIYQKLNYQNNIIDNYYKRYLKTERKYNKLIAYLESYLKDKFNYSYIKELISLYLQKGIVEKKYESLKNYKYLKLFLSIKLNDIGYFKNNFSNIKNLKVDNYINFILNEKKYNFFDYILSSKISNIDNKYVILYKIIRKEKYKIKLKDLKYNEKRFILKKLVELEKYKKVVNILKKVDKNNYYKIRTNYNIYNENYNKAFINIYDYYKKSNHFDYRTIIDLIEKIDIKNLKIKNDKFFYKILSYLLREKKYDISLKIFNKINNSHYKRMALRRLKPILTYKKWRKLVKKFNHLNIIKHNINYLMNHRDKILLKNLDAIKRQTFKVKEKNKLIGDIYFFIKKDKKMALKYYKKINYKPERKYRIFILDIIKNKNKIKRIDNISKKYLNYKYFKIFIGDYYILNNQYEKAKKYYNQMLKKPLKNIIENDLHKRLFYYHKKEFENLKKYIKNSYIKDNLVYWR